MNRANYLIAYTDESILSTPSDKALLGEAYFLRGYYYFILTSYFGEVPLKLTPTEAPPTPLSARPRCRRSMPRS